MPLFLPSLSEAHRAACAAASQSIENLLAQCLCSARAAWPPILVSEDLFLPYLAQRIPKEESVPIALARLRVTDLYLACACAHGDAKAIAELEHRYLSKIAPALGKIGTPHDVIEEVQQFLRAYLLVQQDGAEPHIADFAGRGELFAWLRVVALREAFRIRSVERRNVRVGGDRELDRALSVAADAELVYLKALYRAEFREAFRDGLEALNDEERSLLRFRFVEALTGEQLAAVYRVNRATITRRLAAARSALSAHTRRALQNRLRVTRDEMESILRMIDSEMEVTLGKLLKRS